MSERDPGVGDEDAHPGAPPERRERRAGEDRTPGEEKPRRPVGSAGLPCEPPAFPPHP